MEFTWDPAKSQATWRYRGFDFAFAARIFEGRTLQRPDRRADYGEERVIAVGLLNDEFFTIVFTDRKTVGGRVLRRIISARRSNRRERQAYQKALGPNQTSTPA